MSISAERRNELANLTREERAKLREKNKKRLMEILSKLLGKESDATTSQPSKQPRISAEERDAISQMSEEELVKYIADIDAEMESVFNEFTSAESTKAKRNALAQTAKKPDAPQPPKKQPTQDIWTVKAGESAGCLVTHEVNPRHKSPKRRYRNNEVAHGFPVKNLREFFFFSRRLVSAAYDAPNRKLFLKFNATSLYQYFDVPEKVARDLLNMVSPGSYAYHHICYKFKYERLPFPPQPAVVKAPPKASISQAERDAIMAMSDAELDAFEAKNNKRIEEILNAMLGKEEDAQTPEQKASPATSEPSRQPRISKEERDAISQMTREEVLAALERNAKDMEDVFNEFVNRGNSSTKPEREEMAKTAQKCAEPGKDVDPVSQE